MPTTRDWKEKFDEKFAKMAHIHRGECVITDVSGKQFQAHVEEGKVTEIGGLESVKDFIDSLLASQLAEVREKVEGMMVLTADDVDPNGWSIGHDDALEKVVALLSPDTKEDNHG